MRVRDAPAFAPARRAMAQAGGGSGQGQDDFHFEAAAQSVACANAPALALYAACGFTQVGERRDYYAPGQHARLLRRALVPAATA